MAEDPYRNPALLHILEPDEELNMSVRATTAMLVVTDRRVVVTEQSRILLDCPFTEVRRVQLDVEREQPASLVIVPETVKHEAQVLRVPGDDLELAGRAVALIGLRLGTTPLDQSSAVPPSGS